MMVNKYYTDHFVSNVMIAELSHLSLQELNQLEKEFLYLIDFKLSVDENEYEEILGAVNSFFEGGNSD